MHNRWIQTGAVLMALAVGLGAFGAHGLKRLIPAEAIGTYETGILYHFFHALGLMIIGLAGAVTKRKVNVAASLIAAGILFFSGSLYVLAIRELLPFSVSWIGPITPLGGLCFIAGWMAFIFSKKKE